MATLVWWCKCSAQIYHTPPFPTRANLFIYLFMLFISFLQPISEDFVSRSIRLLKTNKAFGLDKISARLLKDSVDVITPSLTNLQINIFNYLHECELH